MATSVDAEPSCGRQTLVHPPPRNNKASSRFQQLLSAKLAAEKDTPVIVDAAAAPAFAMNEVLDYLQSKDTVANQSFASQYYVQQPAAATKQPEETFQQGPAGLQYSQAGPTYTTNMSSGSNFMPQTPQMQVYEMQSWRQPTTPSSRGQVASQSSLDVKVEPDAVPFDGYSGADWSVDQNNRLSWTSQTSSELPVPGSAHSSVASLPVHSPLTPTHSVHFKSPAVLNLPPSFDYSIPQQPSSSSHSHSLPVKSELLAYGPARFVNMNGAITLPSSAKVVSASTGENNGGAGDWTNGTSNGGMDGSLNHHTDNSLSAGGGGDGSGSGGGGDDGDDPDGGPPGGQDDGPPLDPTPKKKLALACHFCRRRKLKCDGQMPVCQNCAKRLETCTWDDTIRRRGPGKRTKQQREKSLRQTEGRLDLSGLSNEDLAATAEALLQVEGGLDSSAIDGPGPSTLAGLGEPPAKRQKSEGGIGVGSSGGLSSGMGIGVGVGVGSGLHHQQHLAHDQYDPDATYDSLVGVQGELGVDGVDNSFEGTLEGLEALDGLEGLQALQGLDGQGLDQQSLDALKSLDAAVEPEDDDPTIDPALKG